MTRTLTTLLTLALLLPLQAAIAQSGGASSVKLTPEQRAAAQARLAQDAALTDGGQALDASKVELRRATNMMRDSLEVAVATAALITRAQATGSAGVESSQAARLRPQCATLQRTAAATLLALKPLHTPDEKGTRLLDGYRAAVGEVGKFAEACSAALGPADQLPLPNTARIKTAVSKVVAASARHEAAFQPMMRAMEIPIRP